jgi:hypothetical protein
MRKPCPSVHLLGCRPKCHQLHYWKDFGNFITKKPYCKLLREFYFGFMLLTECINCEIFDGVKLLINTFIRHYNRVTLKWISSRLVMLILSHFSLTWSHFLRPWWSITVSLRSFERKIMSRICVSNYRVTTQWQEKALWLYEHIRIRKYLFIPFFLAFFLSQVHVLVHIPGLLNVKHCILPLARKLGRCITYFYDFENVLVLCSVHGL